jgi:hypothetical protein
MPFDGQCAHRVTRTLSGPAGPLDGCSGVSDVAGLLQHVHRRLIGLRQQTVDDGALRSQDRVAGDSQIAQQTRQLVAHARQRR